jgi:cobalt/nickel transport system permease protein
MHLPDGFLDAKTAVIASGAAAGGLGLALRQARATLAPRQMPMLGLAAAFVFAAQMLNFPVVGGTSGHLIGGVLTAILLGPGAAIIVITCVLIVQCLMFADGGLTALGANVFNMGIVNVCGGYLAFLTVKRIVRMEEPRGTVFAAAFAGWFGTVLGSIACAGELAMARTVPWALAFPAMANIHMLIGIGEGVATALITLTVLRARPEMLTAAREDHSPRAGLLAYGVLVALGLAVFVAPFACPWPDGLDAVARSLGFAARQQPAALAAPMSDYHLPFVGSPTVATAIAGLIGTLLAFAAAYGLARLLVPGLHRGTRQPRVEGQ